MKFSSYTQFYRDREERGIEYAAAHAAALGFEEVEYFGRVPSGIERDAEHEREILSRHGLRVSCYSVLVQLFTDDQALVEEQMKKEIKTAVTLGSKYFHHTLFPPYSMKNVRHSYEEVFEGIVDLAERVAKECNRNGIVCLYEPQGVYFNGIDGLERLFFEMKRRGCEVGICGDFGNSLFVDVDPKEIFEHFGKEILHVHVKDYRLTEERDPQKRTYESLAGTLIYDTTLGTGAVDIGSCFVALKKNSYDGTVSFEFEGDDEELRSALARVKKEWDMQACNPDRRNHL